MAKIPRSQRRWPVAAWCLYDWANSAFTTLVVTFVYATYFTQAFAEDAATGTALWSRGLVVSSLLIAVLSPILGVLADRGGGRRRFLVLASLTCILATALLTPLHPTMEHGALMALALFVVANVAFEVAVVFYNSFLPTLADADRIGRVSGYGWALGYVGGLVCLLAGLVGFVGLGDGPWLPLSEADHFNVRATNLLVAGWFLVFSLPSFVLLRETPAAETGRDVPGAWRHLMQTFARVRHYREVAKFLLAHLIYNDGMATIFVFGGIYAAGTFGMSFAEVMVFGIVLNVAAGLGAFLFGYIDDRLGGKKTVLWSLVALFVSTLIAVLAREQVWLWVAGIGIGIFAGPNQSASRSLMGRFVPRTHASEFYGLFAFSGKATTFLGPLLVGVLSEGFGQRIGVSTVLVFFVLGGIVLALVNEERGVAAAQQTAGHVPSEERR